MTTLDQKLVELLVEKLTINGWPFANLILVAIAIILSVILCGIVGIEREWKGRSAGLRTHLLVGVGSCIIMIISLYGFPAAFGEHRDVARLAAQIITGVGFLGAGAIIHHNAGIKGLTTAGTIWMVMAIGIACGSFNFIIAILVTFVVMIVLVSFRKIEIKVNSKKPYIILIAPAEESILEKILSISKEYNCTVNDFTTELIEEASGKKIECTFQAVFANGENRVLEYASKLEKETKAITIQLLGHRK